MPGLCQYLYKLLIKPQTIHKWALELDNSAMQALEQTQHLHQ